MTNSKIKPSQIIYWAFIFFISFSMIIYGILKPLQFENFTNSTNIGVSQGHKLMWTFYSYNKLYPIIIGVLEILGGVTIIFNRTRIIGYIILFTILININLQNYFFEIKALSTSMLYLIILTLLFCFDFKKIKNIFRIILEKQDNFRNYKIILISIILAIILKVLEIRIL
ncbi:hypothetical protein [Empedobacter sp.]|uniref:hypothetical protein n=1 Tax=Empedobacter sp. TaxID=1927715 RepID=UPI0028B01A0A|nr:hypothetical protein [Empedobacter sp.]